MYQVTWVGQPNQSLNLGAHRLFSSVPKYFEDNQLPVPFNTLKSMPGISIVKGTFINPGDSIPQGVDPSTIIEKKQKAGVEWIGTSRRRTVELNGKLFNLETGSPNFDVTDQEADGLSKLGFIKKVYRPL